MELRYGSEHHKTGCIQLETKGDKWIYVSFEMPIKE
jgi:hypothetical protein